MNRRIYPFGILAEGANDGHKELKARGANMISGSRQNVNTSVDLGIQMFYYNLLWQ